MIEYRIDFDETRLTSIEIPRNIVQILGRNGEVREIIPDKKYYWKTSKDVSTLIDLLLDYRGVRIARLQGCLLK